MLPHFAPIALLLLAVGAPQPTSAVDSPCPPKTCLSKWGYCGDTFAHCGPGCLAGSCWVVDASSPAAPKTTPGGKSPKAPERAPDATPTTETSSFDGKSQKMCVLSEDFNSPQSGIFDVDYCPDRYSVKDGSARMQMFDNCGTRLSTRKLYTQGYFETRMRSAATSGVVTSFILRSDPDTKNDELDFEWVGQEMDHVQTNYFVNGVMDHTKGFKHKVGNDTSTEWHVYAYEWTPRYVRWLIDNKEIRRLDNKDDGQFPKQEMRLQFGLWDGTHTSGWAGTVNWAKQPFNVFIDYAKIKYPC